jgi:hypothetical protein
MAQNAKPEPLLSDESGEILGFLTELAKYLIAAGISYSQISKLAELAYLQAACAGARFQNDKVNKSAVAAMTGLNRSQVRALIKLQGKGLPKISDRVEKILLAWTSDSEFLTNSGKPRRLDIAGRESAFQKLVSKCGGDIPARSMLRELLRHRLVNLKDGGVAMSGAAQRTTALRRVSQLSSALTKLIRGPKSRLDDVVPLWMSSAETSFPSPSRLGAILLQKHMATGLKTLVDDIHLFANSSSIGIPPTERVVEHRSRISLLLLSQG